MRNTDRRPQGSQATGITAFLKNHGGKEIYGRIDRR